MAASNSVKKARNPRSQVGHISVEKDGHTYGERHGNDQGEDRRDDRAVDEGQGAEIAINRIPSGSEEEGQAKFLNRELRTRNEFDKNQYDDGKDAERAHQHEGAENPIGKRRATAVKEVRTDGRERRLCPGGRTAICPLGHVTLTSHSRHLSI